MGDQRRSSLLHHHSSEAEGSPHRGQDNGVLGTGTQDTVSGSRRATDAGKLRFEGQDEDALPEEVTGGEVPSPQRPDAALTRLDGGPEKDVDEGVSEMSRLSISQRFPSVSSVRGRKRRRLSELAKPKTNWQVLKDRPSVYWTERFLEDTTLTITVPEVSRRVEELARPKRFYSEYYNNNRITPIWPVPRSSLEHHASTRLRELAAPRIRNNIWSINMSEVSQVSRAAQMAVPSPRVLRLAEPRSPATLLEEWDPMPKPKLHVSDYNRLLHLAMPKAQSNQCVPDRDPRWEVLDVTKKAVASPRIVSLAKPKVRKDLNEGYDPYYVSPASLVARASRRLYELATPKSVTKKV
ncbi:testicular haploid expressed gene protein isoform X6 [Meles meles]|uniref:testicular haploid expressed gene protein isoform X6 n=1 Tax=Meles meles TaxID=9662 RepID=UPI001E6985F7|nr:testicular haploid expressed gene protein isoform X6 [Meles meles]